MGKEISKKRETYKVKLSPSGEIKIPKPVLLSAGLKGEIILTKTDDKILLKPAIKPKHIKLMGCVNANPKIVDEVIENEEFYEEW